MSKKARKVPKARRGVRSRDNTSKDASGKSLEVVALKLREDLHAFVLKLQGVVRACHTALTHEPEDSEPVRQSLAAADQPIDHALALLQPEPQL